MSPSLNDEAAYAHLLGLYLGDGCLWVGPRSVKLQIALDSRYLGIVEGCRVSMSQVAPLARGSVQKRRGKRCMVVSCYWQAWGLLFPQHGPGPKHARPIRLAD